MSVNRNWLLLLIAWILGAVALLTLVHPYWLALIAVALEAFALLALMFVVIRYRGGG
jgi:hypothetical protein